MAFSVKSLNPPISIPIPTLAPNRGGPVACIGGPVARIRVSDDDPDHSAQHFG